MKIKFDDLTDQQCVDIIAHFVDRKNASEVIIHTRNDDIVITKKKKYEKRKSEIYNDVLPTIGCII